MARRTIDDIDSALDYERETRLDRDSEVSNKYEKDSRETFRVAIKRFAETDDDRRESLRLSFESAFVRDDSAMGGEK